ncbi:uncharacterized protein LOC123553741 [Mercenaria mercenaria]|uniref:uncharacterized protein LOC123553741 n=1 Tax=Mercenaria mercenaria TaxID=6596 RepID=UPI00234E9A81|nr:uncharacterized protein LOC123553741 [Mercenaria mercenaria]
MFATSETKANTLIRMYGPLIDNLNSDKWQEIDASSKLEYANVYVSRITLTMYYGRYGSSARGIFRTQNIKFSPSTSGQMESPFVNGLLELNGKYSTDETDVIEVNITDEMTGWTKTEIQEHIIGSVTTTKT